jgi:hypothetical protein
MRPFAFNTWVGVGTAVAALALLSVVLLPASLALKGLGLLLALFALAVSVFLQVRAGRRSTWDVIQDVDHESAPAPARALSGTIELRPRRVR